MKTVYRPRINQPFAKDDTHVLKRSKKLIDLIRQADGLCARGYDYLEPIYKVVQTPDLTQDILNGSINRHRRNRVDRAKNTENIFYEAHLVKIS